MVLRVRTARAHACTHTHVKRGAVPGMTTTRPDPDAASKPPDCPSAPAASEITVSASLRPAPARTRPPLSSHPLSPLLRPQLPAPRERGSPVSSRTPAWLSGFESRSRPSPSVRAAESLAQPLAPASIINRPARASATRGAGEGWYGTRDRGQLYPPRRPRNTSREAPALPRCARPSLPPAPPLPPSPPPEPGAAAAAPAPRDAQSPQQQRRRRRSRSRRRRCRSAGGREPVAGSRARGPPVPRALLPVGTRLGDR